MTGQMSKRSPMMFSIKNLLLAIGTIAFFGMAALHLNHGVRISQPGFHDETATAPQHESDGVASGIALTIDTTSLACTDPTPSRDSVEQSLSFTQTRTCKASAATSALKHPCFDYNGQRACIDSGISVTLLSTDIGTRVNRETR